jgi:hypothetical protein
VLGKIIAAKMDQKSADKQLRNANRMRQESIDLAGQLNWEPDYVSDLVKPYQPAESPLARSFLESLLTGANPSMVQSTRLGANRLKAGAQAGFDDQFGGFDKLLERQRAIESRTPWEQPWAQGTYGHAPAVHKLPQQTPEPPRTSDGTLVSDVDKNASTPQDAANLSELWGLPQEYTDQLRSGFNQAGSTPEAAAQLAEAWGLPADYAEQIRAGKARR